MSVKTKKFLSYYKPYKKLIFADLFFAFLTAVISIIIPYVISYITGELITDKGITNENMTMIIVLIITLAVLLAVEFGSQVFVTYMGHYTGTLMESDLREELFSHYQKLSFTFYDENKTGQLMSRLTNDLFSLTELYHHGPEDIIISLIKIVGSFVILMFINPVLTIIVYAFIPLLIFFILFYNKRMNKVFKTNKRYIAEINEQVEDNLSGIRVVKSFANEEEEKKKFAIGNKNFVESKRIRYKLMGNYMAILHLFATGLQVVVILVGSLLIYYNVANAVDLTVSDFLLYLMLISNLTSAVRQFVAFFETFQEGWTGFERFYELMQVEEEPYEKPDAIELKDVKGKICFNNVDFKYHTSRDLVLKNFNLTVNPGEYIALVGESGVGKSTICSLIPRFYDIQKGSITIDDIDIRNVTLKSLRDNIGIVQQDVYLFNGDVYENINYGNLAATEEEIKAAALRANAANFIENLPDGYYTEIGQRGVRLSGGQKQRLSIARVFLKNPPILIFDEATSSLDNESEYVIQESLEELAKGRTTLVIAHRLSTIRNAKCICVVSEEGIVEAGTHEELLAKNGAYAKLYNKHF
jgi:ATP-binding cassette subfamily B protein